MAEINTEMNTLQGIIDSVNRGNITPSDIAAELETLRSGIESEWSNLEDEKEKLQEKYDELEDKINNLI